MGILMLERKICIYGIVDVSLVVVGFDVSYGKVTDKDG